MVFESWLSIIIGQPLKIFMFSSSCVGNRIFFSKSFQYFRSQSSINYVVCPMAYHTWAFYRKRSILPFLQLKEIFVKLIRKSLSPFSKIGTEELIKNLL